MDDDQRALPPAGSSSHWKKVFWTIFIVVLVAIGLVVITLVVKSGYVYGGTCKINDNCLSSQTCDPDVNRCLSLPGSRCSRNSDCSSRYGKFCQPRDHYCTNDASKGRGAAGNPPTARRTCDAGLELNTTVNLCQRLSIGPACTFNAECGVGVCDAVTKTCQYSTRFCTMDTAMNAHQCAPQFDCDPASLTCTTPGGAAGGDGAPCDSSSDCAPGNNCVKGPPTSGWIGVCRGGSLFWLSMVVEPQTPGLSTTPTCIAPLTADGTNWCRYDIASFMKCSSDLECQYPYPNCPTSVTSICQMSPGGIDPIVAAGFSHTNLGINSSTASSRGAFYTADYPGTPSVEDTTGGRLIDPYHGFIAEDQQFENVAGLDPRGLVFSFSLITSFCVASLAVPLLRRPLTRDVEPVTPYYTALYDDPSPVLVSAALVPTNNAGRCIARISFYRQGYPIPGINNFISVLIQIGDQDFPAATTFIWNPHLVSQHSSSLQPVSFIPNPIVSPWIDITTGGGAHPPQETVTHMMFVTDDSYVFGVLYTALGSDGYTASALTVPAYGTASNPPVGPSTFVIVAWDAISTRIDGGIISTVILVYGQSQPSGIFEMRALSAHYTIAGGALNIQNAVAAGSNKVLLNATYIPGSLTTFQTTQCRLSRANQQTVELLLILTIFSINSSGVLQLSMFAIDSQNPTFVLNGVVQCSGIYTQPGVTRLYYVTPVTGASNYGGFVVWCSTERTEQAFIVIQVNGICSPTPAGGGSPSFWGLPLHSAVYWRKLASETIPYSLYPIGGGATPFFLATDTALRFDGTPTIPNL